MPVSVLVSLHPVFFSPETMRRDATSDSAGHKDTSKHVLQQCRGLRWQDTIFPCLVISSSVTPDPPLTYIFWLVQYLTVIILRHPVSLMIFSLGPLRFRVLRTCTETNIPVLL